MHERQTFLNATIRRISTFGTADPNYQAATLAETAGEPLVVSPKNKFEVEGNYTLPLPASIGRIIFGATFTHTDYTFGK